MKNIFIIIIFFLLLDCSVQDEKVEKKVEEKAEEKASGANKTNVIIHLKDIAMDQIKIIKFANAEEEIVGNSKESNVPCDGCKKAREREINPSKPSKAAEAASKIKESREHAYSIMEHSIKQLSKLFKAFEVPELIKSRFKKYEEVFDEIRKAVRKRFENLRSMVKPKDPVPKPSHPRTASAPPPAPAPAPPPPPPPAPAPPPAPKIKPSAQRLQKLINSNPNIKKISEKLGATKVGQKIKDGLKKLGVSLPEPKSAHEILAEKLVSMHDLKNKLTKAESPAEKMKHFLELSSMMEHLKK